MGDEPVEIWTVSGGQSQHTVLGGGDDQTQSGDEAGGGFRAN